MSRKDDHIHYALQETTRNTFWEELRIIPNSLPCGNTESVDLSTQYLNKTFPLPIYINAMTGGSDKAKEINYKLALIAKKYNIPIASGSVSIALKEPSHKASFTILRETYPEGFIIANIGISAPIENAQKAIDLLKADALQIHMNAPQEIIMPEGDRDFRFWKDNLKAMIASTTKPVIAKEVGFGMSAETLETLKTCGVKHVDLSGRGGTNFIRIENKRRKYPIQGFDNYGYTTLESLLDARKVPGVTLLASGGFERPYDMVKALSLGAKAIGMSGYFLKRVNDNTLEDVYEEFDQLIEDIKKICALLSCKNIEELTQKKWLYSSSLINFMTQRNIKY